MTKQETQEHRERTFYEYGVSVARYIAWTLKEPRDLFRMEPEELHNTLDLRFKHRNDYVRIPGLLE